MRRLRRLTAPGLVLFASSCGEEPALTAASSSGDDAAAAPAILPSTTPHQAGVSLDAPPGGSLVTAGLGDDCLPCHADVAERYRTSGMSDSLSLPWGRGSIEAGLVGRTFIDAETGIRVHFDVKDGTYVQRIVYVDPKGVERGAYEFPIHLVIGSGHATRSYITVREGRMFELPLTWYRQTGALALSPGGYFKDAAGARLYDRCIECHVGDVTVDARGRPGLFTGTISLGISCRRCHGDAPEHARTGKPADVVHPGNLSEERQQDLCAQCHLAGAATLVRPGASLARDYRPGTPVGTLLGVFEDAQVPDDPNAGTMIGGHAARLRMSRCAEGSGKDGRPRLVCTTCHDPHEGHRVSAEERGLDRGCAVCHGAADCTAPPATRTSRTCASCHMAVRGSHDIAHTMVTDHFIQRTPPAAPPAAPDLMETFLGALAARDRILRSVVDAEGRLPETKLLEAHAMLEGIAMAQTMLGKPAPRYVARVEEIAAEIERDTPGSSDASLLRAVAKFHAGPPAEAADALAEHVRRFGAGSDAALYLAIAQHNAGRAAESAAISRATLADDPYEERAARLLVETLLGLGRPVDAVALLAQARELLGPSERRARRMMHAARHAGDRPRLVEAVYDLLMFQSRDAVALAEAAEAVAFAARDTPQARVLYHEALRLAPECVPALAGLAVLEEASGDLDTARSLAERAERTAPGNPLMRSILSRVR